MDTLPFPRLSIASLGLAAALVCGMAWAGQGAEVSPDLRLAIFPPVLTRVEAFRTIILGNAIPVAQTPVPGVWLIHVTPEEPEDVRGALVTGVGPFVRLASAACINNSRK